MAKHRTDTDAIIKMFNSGATATETGKAFGMTRSAVLGVLHRAKKKGAETRTREDREREVDDKHLEGLHLRSIGASWSAISQRLGVSFRNMFADIVADDCAHGDAKDRAEASAYWKTFRG